VRCLLANSSQCTTPTFTRCIPASRSRLCRAHRGHCMDCRSRRNSRRCHHRRSRRDRTLAVVTRDVPVCAVVGGSAARVIRTLEYPDNWCRAIGGVPKQFRAETPGVFSCLRFCPKAACATPCACCIPPFSSRKTQHEIQSHLGS
jgi:hypothetical protein